MRFKTKKRQKKRKIKTFIIFFIISFLTTYNYLNILNSADIYDKELIVKYGINNYTIPNIRKTKIKNILYTSLNYYLDELKNDSTKSMSSLKVSDEPLVYIYNTHQNEEYDTKMFNAYNISYTVETASYILADNLQKYGINTIVEDENISTYLNVNNLTYKDSYKASRYYITEKLKKYPSIKYIIDIHRDSLKREKSTVTINNKNYAKISFVVGLDNSNFNANLFFSEKVNSYIPDISSGIIKKGGNKVNGIYNQDLINTAILIEIGGPENTIEEVNNSIIILAKAIKESIGEENV